MDPERTYLRVHARLSGMLSQLLTPRTRTTVEHACLAVAFALLGLLIFMHANFVQQPGCSSELSEMSSSDAQLVQLKITGIGLWTQSSIKEDTVDYGERTWSESSKIPETDGGGFRSSLMKFWSDWFGSTSRGSGLFFNSWKNERHTLEAQGEKTPNNCVSKSALYDTGTKTETGRIHVGQHVSIKKLLKESVLYFYMKWNLPVIWFWNIGRELVKCDGRLWNHAGWRAFIDAMKHFPFLYLGDLKSYAVRRLENKSKAFEPTYLYTAEKGYFLLPEEAKAQHNIRTINITISAQKSCFGNRLQQLLINSFVGYDTILINSLLSFPGHGILIMWFLSVICDISTLAGYLYNLQTKEFYDLNHGQDLSVPGRFGDYLVTKCGVLVMSLFVFFTTTMSVSFTLRETQDRMLKFTVQLQHHARNQLPTFQLIFVHIVESLVFVPIMIGILFFLFEFYDNQLLAFLVLTLVWLCELFTMISVRTAMSMQFFPRFILLYFLVFHLYFFSYPYGFSYLAFFTTASFMLHLILYFWNRFEVPALQRFMRHQVHLQQHMGFQLSPSAFYTPTLHIARLNHNIVYNGTMPRPEAGSDPLGRADEISSLNSQQTGTAPSSTLLNPFGSFLFWLLDCAPSEGIISFFSMFRDTRDQGHVSDGQIQGGN